MMRCIADAAETADAVGGGNGPKVWKAIAFLTILLYSI